MIPTIKIEKTEGKRSIANKTVRALKKAGMFKELNLFEDFLPFVGPGKVGRIETAQLAAEYLTVIKKLGKGKTVQVTKDE